MSELANKLRKAREKQVDVGGFTFTVRRPTDIEAMRLRDVSDVGDLVRFVIGWQGVRECDLISGGDPHPLAFAADVATEWLSDRPDLLLELSNAILDLYAQHRAALEDAAKN